MVFCLKNIVTVLAYWLLPTSEFCSTSQERNGSDGKSGNNLVVNKQQKLLSSYFMKDFPEINRKNNMKISATRSWIKPKISRKNLWNFQGISDLELNPKLHRK